MDDSKLSHRDAIPTGGDEAEAPKVAFDERNPYWTVPFEDERGTIQFEERPRADGVIKDKENTRKLLKYRNYHNGSTAKKDCFDLTFCQLFKTEGTENLDIGSAIRLREVKDKVAKFRPGRSAKDGGYSSSIAGLDMLSSLASCWATSFATISRHFSFSLRVGILLLMPYSGVEGALTSVPTNTVFVVGKTARINCSTDLNQPVYWARTLAGSNVQQWLYYGKNGLNGNNVDGRFSMGRDDETGRYDVIIADVQLKDAGQYVCIDESGLGVTASAELIVSDPLKCNSRLPSDGVMGYNVFGIKQDVIHFSCSLTYTGNLSPTLQWSWPGSEVQSDGHQVTAAKSSIASTLKLSPTKEQNNMKFQCKATIEGAAQHPIDSGLLWESETVNVRYAQFASIEVDVCPGVKWNLVCNPQCSYHFERNDSDCQCLYTYNDTRTQQQHQVTSDSVRCCKYNDIHYVVFIAVVVVVVAALSVATIIVLVCCLKKKLSKWRPSYDSKESDQNSRGNQSDKPMLKSVKTISK